MVKLEDIRFTSSEVEKVKLHVLKKYCNLKAAIKLCIKGLFIQKHPELPRFIMETLERGVTCWKGHGGYTGQPLEVLCVCLNKYEIETLRREIRKIDPQAFFIVQEGVQVGGHFEKHLY